MANVIEQSLWEVGVYQIETSDAILGGVNGIANRQALQLANRTLWLKDQVLGLGSGKQAADATLTALAGLNTSADRLIYATGADQFALTPLTAFIRTLLDDANAAAALATLGAAPLASPALTGTPTAPTAATGTNTTQVATTAFVNAVIAADRPFESTLANIKMDGAQSVGSLNTVARGDHIHPTDTSRAPLASPALTGTPTAPTAATGTNTTQVATTAFVNAVIAADRPFEATLANIKMDGAQSVGSLNTVARGDHVHPTDTSRAPLASPALTGIPTAPTASTGTRSTQLATTAFVGAESQIAAPTGSVYTFAGSTVPTGWLKCNGALLSRTTYASLFAVIGTTYGAGDGSTTFALPDLRGEFVRGADDGRGVDAGRVLGAWQNHSMQRHNHYLPTSTGSGNSHFVIPDGAWGISTPNEYPSSGMAPAVTINADNNANSASGNAGNFSSETVPRNVAMHFIIKY